MIENYIKVYDNSFTKRNCAFIIDKFESSKEEHLVREVDNYIKFTEINISRSEKWKDIIPYIVGIGNKYVQNYIKDCGIHPEQFPKKYGWEEIRIKRYLPNNHDEFKMHVDVTDHDSAKRFLVFFWYLNDVNEGGETTFGEDKSIIIKPESGKLLMFPPLWPWLHAGEKPVSGPKYIIGSYLHYI